MRIPTHVSKKEPKTATQSKLTSSQYFCCDQQVDVEGNKKYSCENVYSHRIKK